ncbi:MAG: hypothetical protein KatS3mg020_0403 [Fimbriimonadales bacterium]|nr:MAG: hypothetical protein KatS3mg020_0403 [Fimbriimonadales bacterium]
MRDALEGLQQAIQQTLALGLSRAGGLEPLRDALRAVQRYESLASLTESLQAILEPTDVRAQLNALARLHYTCEQCLARLQVYALPKASPTLQDEPTRRAAAPDDAEPFVRLFRGEAALPEALPAIRQRVWSWQPDQPILPLQLALAHSGTAYLAIVRLQSLGEAALPVLIRLVSSKSLMTRLRACELLLDYREPKATAALRSALPNAPRALPLFQKLRRRSDLLPIFTNADAPLITTWLTAVGNRDQFRQMLQRAAAQIMLQPPDSDTIPQLIEKAQQIARGELDHMRLLAAIPHEQATRSILEGGWLTMVGFEHLCATLDYRLTPLVLSVYTQFGNYELNQLNRMGDAAFLPWALQEGRKQLGAYGEAATTAEQRG